MKLALTSILACPDCRGALSQERDQLQCERCDHAFSIQSGAAVFLPGPVEIVPAEHESNALGAEFEATLREGKQFVLHVGAGATPVPYPNCVELEHKIFRHTDVVGDAHRLPFRDGVFDRVFAFNVFEHLREPKLAATEMFRVLKPGGAIAIHTAFLQPLHEEPFHFYNATAYGAREWFDQFEIERCEVSANFSPAYMLSFLASQVLEAVRLASVSTDEQILLSKTSLRDWENFWKHRTEPPAGFHTLQNLPQSLQQRIAAGFELIARKPAAVGGARGA